MLWQCKFALEIVMSFLTIDYQLVGVMERCDREIRPSLIDAGDLGAPKGGERPERKERQRREPHS